MNQPTHQEANKDKAEEMAYAESRHRNLAAKARQSRAFWAEEAGTALDQTAEIKGSRAALAYELREKWAELDGVDPLISAPPTQRVEWHAKGAIETIAHFLGEDEENWGGHIIDFRDDADNAEVQRRAMDKVFENLGVASRLGQLKSEGAKHTSFFANGDPDAHEYLLDLDAGVSVGERHYSDDEGNKHTALWVAKKQLPDHPAEELIDRVS